MYDVKKYILLFALKLLPEDLFECPLVLVLPKGMSCHSQISGFGAFQDLIELSHLPSADAFSD